jgi:hypothetical protein
MPAIYDNLGVRFLYPENWSITDEDDEGWPRTVTVQSPETGFWTLHILPAGDDPQPAIDELVAAITADFGDVEVLPAKEAFGDVDAAGVDLAFFYLDLLVEAKIRCLKTPSATLVWLYQAESREFEKSEAVFQAMAVSMLREQVALPE